MRGEGNLKKDGRNDQSQTPAGDCKALQFTVRILAFTLHETGRLLEHSEGRMDIKLFFKRITVYRNRKIVLLQWRYPANRFTK